MNSDTKKTKQEDQIDWRNTLYQFHLKAVPKYKLKPQEIAVYTAMFSSTKKTGFIQIGNAELMKKSGIVNNVAFRKSRDKLIECGIISIVKKGNIKKVCTTYKLKLLGRPKKNRTKELGTNPNDTARNRGANLHPVLGTNPNCTLGTNPNAIT